MSSFLNPCVYVWRSEKFRLALYKTLGLSRSGRRSKKNIAISKHWNRPKNPQKVGASRIINVKTLECTENFEHTEGTEC